MNKAFEVVDRFMEYGVYKIRNMLLIRLEFIKEYPEMTENKVTFQKR